MTFPIQPDKFLLPEDDGLTFRKSQSYALYKLKALETYINMAITAVKKNPWRERYYIDLQAGPGKNRIGSDIVLGSPLLALKAGFTQYRFNELDKQHHQSLQYRVSGSSVHDRIKVYQKDANEVVHEICDEIEARDRQYIEGQWSCFNIAFLDPEGLELHWTTVERLAKQRRMDLIINFSTGGLRRSAGKQQFAAGDRVFGTQEWREIISTSDTATVKRHKLINFYLNRLKLLDNKYTVKDNPSTISGIHIPIKNSRNTQVYSLIFASKHPLGDALWAESAKRSNPQRSMFDD